MQPQPARAAVLLAREHAVAHEHPVGLPVLDAAQQVRVGAGRLGGHQLVADGLDGADLEPQVPQLRLVGLDVVLEVADLFFQVQDAGGGCFGPVDEEGVEVLCFFQLADRNRGV